jgi:GAF domain-containing protein
MCGLPVLHPFPSDIREDREFRTPRVKTMQDYWTVLAVPMIREGIPIGALALWRPEVRPFTETEIGLVQTFADQAVIAIENVRLFKELEARTASLTRSVEQLTALGEVGRAVSSTLDLETVLQTIVTRTNHLAGTAGCTIWEYDEPREEFRLHASHYADETDAPVLQAIGRVTTIRKGQGVTTRMRVPSGDHSSRPAIARCSACSCSARTRSSACWP